MSNVNSWVSSKQSMPMAAWLKANNSLVMCRPLMQQFWVQVSECQHFLELSSGALMTKVSKSQLQMQTNAFWTRTLQANHCSQLRSATTICCPGSKPASSQCTCTHPQRLREAVGSTKMQANHQSGPLIHGLTNLKSSQLQAACHASLCAIVEAAAPHISHFCLQNAWLLVHQDNTRKEILQTSSTIAESHGRIGHVLHRPYNPHILLMLVRLLGSDAFIIIHSIFFNCKR